MTLQARTRCRSDDALCSRVPCAILLFKERNQCIERALLSPQRTLLLVLDAVDRQVHLERWKELLELGGNFAH